MDIRTLIQDTGPFQGLPEDILDRIARAATVRIYGAGEIIVNETEAIGSLSVILEGRVKLSKTSPEGKEQTLALLGRGDPFGLCTAFASREFPATVTALERSTILTLGASVLQETAKKEPLLLFNIIRLLSERLVETMELAESLSLKSLPQRIATFILHHLSGQGPSREGPVHLSITHRELAKIVGATPEALSRAIRHLVEDGIIEIKGKEIRVHDWSALEELAGQ